MANLEDTLTLGLVYSSPASALAAMVWAWRSRVLRRVLPGHCANCSYDLTGIALDKPCPECGVASAMRASEAGYLRAGPAYRRAAVALFGAGLFATLVGVVPGWIRHEWESAQCWIYFVPFVALAILLAVLAKRVDGASLVRMANAATLVTALYMVSHLAWLAFSPPTGWMWVLMYYLVVFIALGVAGHAFLLGVWWAWRTRSAAQGLARPR